MTVNGFEIKVHLKGTSAQYYTAKRGNQVYTSKDINYLLRMVKNR